MNGLMEQDMRVTFWMTTKEGQEPMFTLESDGVSVRVIDGDVAAAKELGVLAGPMQGEMQAEYWPKDGRAYMDALHVQFSGSYVRATPVQD